MEGSIRPTEKDRKNLLQVYRSGNGGRVVDRAQILLLLADGLTYREVRRVVFCSFDLISECGQRFRAGGVAGVLDQDAKQVNVPIWLARVVQWLLTRTPRDFGYFRSRWSCQTLAEVLAWETGERESSETIRRGLERLGFVWRRPRPVVGPVDPHADAGHRTRRAGSPDIEYTGELPRRLVVINHLWQHGRQGGGRPLRAGQLPHSSRPGWEGSRRTGRPGGNFSSAIRRLRTSLSLPLQPIRYGSLSLAVCAAMSIGLPIVGLATTEMPRVVENGVSGYISSDFNVLCHWARENQPRMGASKSAGVQGGDRHQGQAVLNVVLR